MGFYWLLYEASQNIVRVILNKIYLSLFTASLCLLISHLFRAFDHFGVLLLQEKKTI